MWNEVEVLLVKEIPSLVTGIFCSVRNSGKF